MQPREAGKQVIVWLSCFAVSMGLSFWLGGWVSRWRQRRRWTALGRLMGQGIHDGIQSVSYPVEYDGPRGPRLQVVRGTYETHEGEG